MTSTPWLDEAEARAWRGYRRMRALLDLELTRDLADDSKLSDADYDVLSSLSESPEKRLRIRQLAEQLLWSTSRLSHQITRMQQRGLVAREDCPSDARGAVVVLTADGWRTIEAAAPSHVASVRRHLIDLLSPAQISALGDITETVVRHLNAEVAPPGARTARSRNAVPVDASARRLGQDRQGRP